MPDGAPGGPDTVGAAQTRPRVKAGSQKSPENASEGGEIVRCLQDAQMME